MASTYQIQNHNVEIRNEHDALELMIEGYEDVGIRINEDDEMIIVVFDHDGIATTIHHGLPRNQCG